MIVIPRRTKGSLAVKGRESVVRVCGRQEVSTSRIQIITRPSVGPTAIEFQVSGTNTEYSGKEKEIVTRIGMHMRTLDRVYSPSDRLAQCEKYAIRPDTMQKCDHKPIPHTCVDEFQTK